MSENKTGKYFKYAIGEIVLVVIGILIALQINNWNNERIEKDQLNGLLQSISNGVKSDIKDLNLLLTARASVSKKVDSIFNTYITDDKKVVTIQEATFINYAFKNVLNTISFTPNLSTFEALNNSSFLKIIQGSDLTQLFNAYVTSANQIKKSEENYHETLRNNVQSWSAKFKNSGQHIFYFPWEYTDENSIVHDRFLEVLRDAETLTILFPAIYEFTFNPQYENQILMGNKLIEMVENSQTSFDEQTKLDFSGILYSFADADFLSVLINGEVPTGFDIRYAASGLFGDNFSNENDYLVIKYPENTYDWGAPYFWVNALNGRVNEMDFSNYSKMIIEMKGSNGGETFDIVMKDKNDPPDGSEFRIKMELTKDWKTYEINTSEFITADMQIINMPLGFVFQGAVGREIHVRSVQFRKD